MAYECHNFCNGEVLTAEQLNDMDRGIAALDETVGDIQTALDSIIAVQNSLIGGGAE